MRKPRWRARSPRSRKSAGRPAAERKRRDVAADQQKVGAELLHQVEFALGAGEVPRTLRLASRNG
jgi:hypothetical protein